MALHRVNLVLVAAGVATHLVFFNRGEHHLNGARYVQTFLALYIMAIMATSVFLEEPISRAASHASSLAIFYLAGIYASLLMYRVSFGPLRKFPGPFGARISSFWFSFHLAKHDAYRQFVELHEEYGDFVRIGSNEVSILHPRAVEAIYGPGSQCQKGTWYDLHRPMVSMQTTRSHSVHDKRRRVWSKAFSDKALRGYQQRIKTYQDRLIASIASFGDQPLNITKYFNSYGFDVMGDLAFGKSFDMLLSNEGHWAINLLTQGLEPLGLVLPVWFFRMLLGIPSLTKDWWKFINYCSQMLDQRMTMSPTTPDIMSTLLEPYKDTKPTEQDMEMLRGDSELLVVAGSDTVSSTLTYLCYQLARNPEHITKLREDIIGQNVSSPEDVVDLKLQDLEHLNAVIFETLRLHPPVPGILPRMTPPEGLQIDDTHVPGDVTVWVSQYAIGRSERVYKKASSFIPERWYSESTMINDRSAFAPFNIGRYGCIGRPLAMLNLRTTLAKLLLTYDISFPPGDDRTGAGFENKCKDHFTIATAPLNLVFRKRQTKQDQS